MKQSFKLALISLIISFTLLFPLSIFLTFKIVKSESKKNKTTQVNKIKYNIPKSQDITLLILITPSFKEEKNLENFKFLKDKNNSHSAKSTQQNNLKDKYIVLKISAHSNKITILEISKKIKTIVQTNEGFPIAEGTLENIYQTAGMYYLKKAIEQKTKMDINNTLRMDYNSIYGFINQIGGIKITKDKKTKILKYEKFIKILEKNPTKAISLIKNSLNNKTNLTNVFVSLSNLSLTDITINEFESRKEGIKKLITEKNCKLETREIKS